MKPPYFNNLNNAIKVMHARHGIGDVLRIRQYADGRIEVEAQGYGMKPHTRRGRVVGGPFGRQTIKMYGRQMTVFVVGGEPE